ncbi:hypothetical protein F4680DRAFT_165735 [Xylaria scruposa]|nr:hypothetical protein F4680DRAFT_165735 [Xylaria scruposa]
MQLLVRLFACFLLMSARIGSRTEHLHSTCLVSQLACMPSQPALITPHVDHTYTSSNEVGEWARLRRRMHASPMLACAWDFYLQPSRNILLRLPEDCETRCVGFVYVFPYHILCSRRHMPNMLDIASR